MLERIHLEIIKNLKEFGSLTKAAEKLCLTQPALTHSIRKLEGILGVKLWIKNGRDLVLTQAGEYIYRKSQEILPGFTRAESELYTISQGKKGRLKVGVECHPCYKWLLGIIKGYLQEWKDVDVDVTNNFQFDGIDALVRRKIDLVITPDKREVKGLNYVPVLNFELKLVTTEGLSGSFITPDFLRDKVIYTYPVPKDRLDVYNSFLIPGEISPKEHIEVEATELILELVATGRGVTTFPDWLIERYRGNYQLNSYSLGKGGIKKQLYMVHRDEDGAIPYLKDFIDRGIGGV